MFITSCFCGDPTFFARKRKSNYRSNCNFRIVQICYMKRRECRLLFSLNTQKLCRNDKWIFNLGYGNNRKKKVITCHNTCRVQYLIHSPHRISAGGSLSFMRCVSLTLTGLISAWRRGEASSAILAKSLSDCVTVLCLGQCKSRHLKVCGIMKRTCYFQTNGMSCILNWDIRCLCCRWRWFQVLLLLFWASSSNLPPPPPPPN